jgi:hypothetical protein
MPKLVPPTTKNSPAVVTGKNRDNKPAEAYASRAKEGLVQKPIQTINDLNPSAGGVSKGNTKPIKTDGIKIRGTGAATKGVMARGPMA